MRIVEPDPQAVARRAAALLVDLARQAMARQGRFALALAGGNTPLLLYRLLAAEPLRSQMPWPATLVFWGDERHLPPGHPGRNDTDTLPLLVQAGVPAANIFPAPYVPGDLEAAAAGYEATVHAQARPGLPLLDLVLLGLGSDGHTASLFPGTPALDERDRLVVANRAAYEDRHPERITLTLPALNGAAAVLFLVTGAGKRQIVRRVLGPLEDPPLPAQLVQPASGRLWWLLDRDAAP